MYLIEKIAKPELSSEMFKQQVDIFGVQVPVEADRCEIWGTTFTDPQPDCCEYRFFKDDISVGVQRIAGY